MKTLTWQFSTGDSAISSAIRWKTDSEISHVDVVTPEGKLLGAHINDGVLVREPDYMKFKLRIRVTVPVGDEQFDEFWASAKSKIGEQYDCAGIVGIALGDNRSSKDEVFCSELQAQGIKDAGIIWIAKDASKIDPETLRLLVTAIPGAKEERIEG